MGKFLASGEKISLLSVHGKYVCAEDNGNAVANRPSPGPWEQLTIETSNPYSPIYYGQSVSFRGIHGKYLCAEDNGNAVANRPGPGPWETFVVVNSENPNSTGLVRKHDKVAFRGCHGKFLCAEQNGDLVANRPGPGPWETFTIDFHGLDSKFSLSNTIRLNKKVSLQSVHGPYVCGEDNGNAVANRPGPGPWETFKIKAEGGSKHKGPLRYNSKVHFKTVHKKYLCAEDNGNAVANRPGPGPWETFLVVDPQNPNNNSNVPNGGKVAFRGAHGKFLCAEQNGDLVANRPGPGPWETFTIRFGN